MSLDSPIFDLEEEKSLRNSRAQARQLMTGHRTDKDEIQKGDQTFA